MIRHIQYSLRFIFLFAISAVFSAGQLQGQPGAANRKGDLPSPQVVLKAPAHIGSMTSLAFSPDGRHLLSSGTDRFIKIWDTATGREVFRTEVESAVPFVSFLGGVEQFVSCSQSEKETVIVWDGVTGRPVRTLSIPGQSHRAILGPDGGLLVHNAKGAAPPNVLQINLKTMQITNRFSLRSGDSFLAAAVPDKGQVLLASRDGKLRLMGTDGWWVKKTLEGHAGDVRALAVDGLGKTAVSGGADRTVRVWKLAKGTGTLLGAHDAGVAQVAIDRNGSRAVSIDDRGAARVRDLARGADSCTFETGPERVVTLQITPDGRFSATGHLDGQIKIWDLSACGQLRTCEPFAVDAVRTLRLTRELGVITVGTTNHTVYVWKLFEKTFTRAFEGHTARIIFLYLSRDEHWLVTSSDDRTIRIWEVATGKEVRRLGVVHPRPIERLVFSSDEKFLAAIDADGAIDIRDVAEDRSIAKCGGHPQRITSASFANDGRILITADRTNEVRLWDVKSGLETQRMKLAATPKAYSVSPDGMSFFAEYRETGGIRGELWSVTKGTRIQAGEVMASTDNWVRSHASAVGANTTVSSEYATMPSFGSSYPSYTGGSSSRTIIIRLRR